MPTYKIPNQNGQIRQLNLNDTAGEILVSRNLDLRTVIGKAKLARPLKQVATATQIGNSLIQGFASTGTSSQANELYAITDSVLYSSDNPFTSWASESTTPQAAEDCCVFQGQMIISTDDDLDAFNFISTYTSDWWTARSNPSLTTNNPASTVPRVIDTARVGAETLVVLDGSNVYGYVGGITSGAVTSVTMDLDSSLTACCFKAGIRSGWIGTYTKKAEQAYVIQWDCASTNYTQAFPVGSKAVLAIELVDDVPLIVTERGEIKMFNNAGFTTVAQFPFATKATFVDQATNPNNVNRPIHPKGMRRMGNTVYIQTNFRNADGSSVFFDDKSHNGIWALDLTTYSLTHLASQGNEVLFDGQGASPLMVIDDYNGRLFVGGDRMNALTSSEEGIWMEDLSNSTTNYGYFVTTEINASDVKDVFDYLSIKALLGTDDEIKVKYRTSNDTSLPINISDATWTGVNENQFTSTDTDLATIKTRYDAGHRDEIEVLAGQSAGRLAHITNITYSNPTYTVTIDEQIGVDGETSYIRFDNWKLIDKTMTQTDGNVQRFGIGVPASFAQFKIALSGKAGRPEIREILIKTNPKEK